MTPTALSDNITRHDMVELGNVDLPEFGLPLHEPQLEAKEYELRIDQVRRMMETRRLDFLVVYGDREHFSNMEFLIGHDPRFEEAILVLNKRDIPLLILGNEGWGHSQHIPITIERRLWQSLSLLGQPRGQCKSLEDILREAGIGPGMAGGVVGWKYFSETEFIKPQEVFEVPSFLIDTLRNIMGDGKLINAGDLFVHVDNGLRCINSVNQLARFEFTATHASQAFRNALFHVKPGMTELEIVQEMRLPGLPLSCHIMVSAGPRAHIMLLSPTNRSVEIGDPFLGCVGMWGGASTRAGFIVETASQLDSSIRDYIDKLVKPYFAAIVDWYETIGIGVTGNELYEAVHRHLGDPFFKVTLNPGHLIHTDEWVHSPVYRGSSHQLKAGTMIQVDVIPATGTPYFTSNLEDTVALADTQMRVEFATLYPEAWKRIQARRLFMQEVLGINLKPDVLPFSNIPAYLPPFLLAPHRAMHVKR